MQDWQTAKKYAELSLKENDDLRNIAAGFDGTFIEPNNEEISFVMGGETFGNTNFPRPGQSYYGMYIYSPNWIISDHLYNLYEEGDARRDVFFGREYGDGNAPYYKKTDIEYSHLGSYKGTSDQFCYRSAEAYLNAAEAALHLGDAQTAKTYMDAIRNRAHTTPRSAYTLDDVLDERAREMYFEGIRRPDLIRYNRFGGVDVTYGWEGKGGNEGYTGAPFEKYLNVYPIPSTEIQANRNLVQIEGYPEIE
jgi:hypothetical protein